MWVLDINIEYSERFTTISGRVWNCCQWLRQGKDTLCQHESQCVQERWSVCWCVCMSVTCSTVNCVLQCWRRWRISCQNSEKTWRKSCSNFRLHLRNKRDSSSETHTLTHSVFSICVTTCMAWKPLRLCSCLLQVSTGAGLWGRSSMGHSVQHAQVDAETALQLQGRVSGNWQTTIRWADSLLSLHLHYPLAQYAHTCTSTPIYTHTHGANELNCYSSTNLHIANIV